MKINKIAFLCGIIIVSSIFTFAISIPVEVVCRPPIVSKTVSDVKENYHITVDGGVGVCKWIHGSFEIKNDESL